MRHQPDMTLLAFQDMARELIASAGCQIDTARSYAYVLADGECHAIECSVETWGVSIYGAPRVECAYHKYPNKDAHVWISIEEKQL